MTDSEIENYDWEEDIAHELMEYDVDSHDILTEYVGLIRLFERAESKDGHISRTGVDEYHVGYHGRHDDALFRAFEAHPFETVISHSRPESLRANQRIYVTVIVPTDEW